MARLLEYRRAVPGIELRDNSDGTITLAGYASTFGEPYDMGTYTETVRSGAFRETLGRQPDVRFLINHDGLPLARTTSGTLRLEEDARGLRMEADLNPSDPDVQAILPKIQRGDLNQMSFGFRINAGGQEWTTTEGRTQRTLTNLNLAEGDVSIVTYPANPGTSIGFRSGSLTEEEIAEAIAKANLRTAAEFMQQMSDRDMSAAAIWDLALSFRGASNSVEPVAADHPVELVDPSDDNADDETAPEVSEDAERASALADAEARRRFIAGL